MKDCFNRKAELKFLFPIDGDCLNSFDGTVIDGHLVIRAVVEAPKDADVYINECRAVYSNGVYEAKVTLYGRRNTIFAEDRSDTGSNARIAVYDFRHAEDKYRISSDDNIMFLKDITDNKDTYSSVFDNPYLAVYKEAHDKYGACVHLNLFYETDEQPGFLTKFDYFNLSMMTDKFKSEWEANSDWLRLSFHSRTEHPDSPYENTTLARITEDARLINREICRFAGEKTLAHTCTVHFGASNIGGVRALRALGYQTLTGYFELKKGKTFVAYYYPDDLVSHIGDRDFWMNTEEDVLHGRIDLVLNTIRYEELIPRLTEIKENPHRFGFLELMIHEQYFYENYKNYIPRFHDLVLDAAKFAFDNGKHGALLDDIALAGQRIG